MKKPILPFKEYIDAFEDPTRCSMFKAKIALVTGKSVSSISRYANGVVRPEYVIRNVIAAEINDGRTGEELFPANYPYKGSHAKAN